MIPSAHSVGEQWLGQLSVSTPFPSSHNSPASTWPSPHTVQLSRQRLPLPPAGEPGGSQDSPLAGSKIPSPHLCVVQLLGHPSAPTPLPSSHSSPAST